MKKFPIIPVTQPIGTFYLSVLPAAILLPIVTIKQRTLAADSDGIQRGLSKKRVSDIALYTTDPDATFPTPIIVACDDDKVNITNGEIEFDEKAIIGEVIDGQHRIRGLFRAGDVGDFELPVVFMLGLERYERAYVFSTINSKQTPVAKSLIYDLFGLSEHRSPFKTCHEIARTLNASRTGPFFQGLKMLGKRTAETEYLTQGSFVTNLMQRISKQAQADEIAVKNGDKLEDNNSLAFRYYWINDQDEVIVKILENYFGAIQDEFHEEWNHPTAKDFILRKTVGFVALLGAFDQVWEQARQDNKASKEYFATVASNFRANLKERPLVAGVFGSSAAAAGKLRDAFLGTG